ncbi:MAG: hypothetical protein QNJ53_31385 [Pleurocapsa sp. MO_192.B19]|nr:hypothetical protein [Pleurocapsa sp. MO_192.B19]
MKNATMIEIKHVENSLEVLNDFGIEIGLDGILIEEFERGLPSDLSHPGF